jgi:malate dehydrogenase (oxaloacetate-decarboxylating)
MNKVIKAHKKAKGKISIQSTMPIKNKEDLSIAYTPGVALVSEAIHSGLVRADEVTARGHMVAVISDGSAVLGLGNIGPDAALPVMEGKCALFKEFAGIDAFPIVLDTQNEFEIIQAVKAIAPSFGGINLEDIAAPKCVYIEETLQEILDIPIFHDDQHGTAIVVLAALINALKIVKKNPSSIKVTVIGTGSAGNAIIRLLSKYGIKNIRAINKEGVVSNKHYSKFDNVVKRLLDQHIVNSPEVEMLEELISDTDVVIGVSVKGLITKDMLKSMNDKSIVFALANPYPEITYEDAKEAGAYIIGTGRSDYPNQINNVLAFPGIFKGVLGTDIKHINSKMMINAAVAIASLIDEEELTPEYVIPSVFDKRVVHVVASAIKEEK